MMGRRKTIAKVGLLSTLEHNPPYVRALTDLGFKVVQLDGHCTSIPNSIKFCIIKVQCVSHTTTDVALAWARRSPETRVLAFCNGVSDVKGAGERYKQKLADEQAERAQAKASLHKRPTTAESLKAVKKRARKQQKVAAAPSQSEASPMVAPPQQKKKEFVVPMNTREKLVMREVSLAGKMGIGVHDLRKAWEVEFGKAPAKSTIGSYLAKLVKLGWVVNLGGSGRSHRGNGPKAAWYMTAKNSEKLTVKEYALEEGTPQRTAYEDHLQRFRARPVENASVAAPPTETTPYTEPPMKVVAIPPLRKEPDTPMESIKSECELLVLWLREWNVNSLSISEDGAVELSGNPTKSPELEVRFTVK